MGTGLGSPARPAPRQWPCFLDQFPRSATIRVLHGTIFVFPDLDFFVPRVSVVSLSRSLFISGKILIFFDPLISPRLRASVVSFGFPVASITATCAYPAHSVSSLGGFFRVCITTQ